MSDSTPDHVPDGQTLDETDLSAAIHDALRGDPNRRVIFGHLNKTNVTVTVETFVDGRIARTRYAYDLADAERAIVGSALTVRRANADLEKFITQDADDE